MSKRIKNLQEKNLSQRHNRLTEVSFDYEMSDGSWVSKNREVLHRGNAATALLYNSEKKTVILNKQFRIPTLLNGNESGFMLEAPAGNVESEENPDLAIVREIREETGYQVSEVRRILEFYTSPGYTTEKMFCYLCEITEEMRVGEGGGLASEHEDIQVLEMSFEEALNKVETRDIVDAKTIAMLYYAKANQVL